MAAVNKSPKTWCFTTHLFSYRGGDQESEVSFTGLKSRWWENEFLLTVPGDSTSLAFSSFWGPQYSVTHSPFFISLQSLASLVFYFIFYGQISFCLPLLRILWLHSGPTWIAHDSIPISRSLISIIFTKSLLLCKVTFTASGD